MAACVRVWLVRGIPEIPGFATLAASNQAARARQAPTQPSGRPQPWLARTQLWRPSLAAGCAPAGEARHGRRAWHGIFRPGSAWRREWLAVEGTWACARAQGVGGRLTSHTRTGTGALCPRARRERAASSVWQCVGLDRWAAAAGVVHMPCLAARLPRARCRLAQTLLLQNAGQAVASQQQELASRLGMA